MIPIDVYPYLHEHGRQHLTGGPHRDVSAFEFGLDLILTASRESTTRRPSISRKRG
jgi:hypothetical protein